MGLSEQSRSLRVRREQTSPRARNYREEEEVRLHPIATNQFSGCCVRLVCR